MKTMASMPRLVFCSLVIYPGVVAGEDIPVGSAVALVGDLDLWRLCGARVSDHANSFVGFAGKSAQKGENFPLICAREFRFEPVVEGRWGLFPGEFVFLSLTPGQVTQTIPQKEDGIQVLRVGRAVGFDKVMFDPKMF